MMEVDSLSGHSKARLQKLANATERSFADENKLLFEQNKEKKVRASTKSSVVGRAKVMSYEDIVAAQKKRQDKEAEAAKAKTKAKAKEQLSSKEKRRAAVSQGEKSTNKASRTKEKEKKVAQGKIEAVGLDRYCSVIEFWRWAYGFRSISTLHKRSIYGAHTRLSCIIRCENTM